MNNFKQQQKTLEKIFKKTFVLPKITTKPEEAEDTYFVPKWSKLGKTYPEALQKVLDAIKSTRPFYNWREKEMDKFTPLSERPEIIHAQMGSKWEGKSVENVRKSYTKNEYGLGVYEVGIILLLKPELLQKHENLWIECPGDDFTNGGFSRAPVFEFSDDGVRFGTRWVGDADDHCGSASGFLPQLKIESGNLESFESLTLRIEELDNFKSKVDKILKLE